MLIVRGVNVFPTAIREIVAEFAPRVSGVIAIRPKAPGVRQSPPLPIAVELAEDGRDDDGLAASIAGRIRDRLLVTVEITLVPFWSLPRSDYKSKLVEWPTAGGRKDQ